MDEHARKIGLVSIAGVVVRIPRFWVITVYVCKLLGFSSIFSVYSCILIRASAFSEAAPWLLNCCMAFRVLTGSSLLKPRQEEMSSDASLQWCRLYASSSTVNNSTSMLKHTSSSSAEWSVVLVISPFMFLIMVGLVAELQKSSIIQQQHYYNGFLYSCCVYFPCHAIVQFYGLFYGEIRE